MATLINQYVIDACALIAYFRDEKGGDKLEALFETANNHFLMHAVKTFMCYVYFQLLN